MGQELPDGGSTRPRAITWRSVSLGLIATCIISSIAYYNDFAVNNTFFIGNNLPLGLVMMTFLFIVLVNGPLSRWAPGQALNSGELVVAFSMALVACAIPSGGLMRWLAHAIVAPFWHAQGNAEFRDLLLRLEVPNWLFPSFSSDDRLEWFNDPIVTGFLMRWTAETTPPYTAWIRPIIVWGIPTFAIYGAVICIMAIVRHQWAENERLPFPLVQIQLSLLEAPQKGRWFNNVLSRRTFWMGFSVIFLIHLWNGGSKYFQQYIPEIPISYDLVGVFSEAPLVYVTHTLKRATIFFTVVGVAYFLTSSISFSIWSIFLIFQLYRVFAGALTGDPETPGLPDQRFGGVMAYGLVIVWLGRQHWKVVIAQAFRGPRKGEPQGRFLSYPLAFWGLVGSALVLAVWLRLAGCDWLGAGLMVFMILTLFMITARFVAETGLLHSPALVPLFRPLQYMGIAGWAARPPVETFYLTGAFEHTHYDQRETLAVYSSHAMRLSDHTMFGDRDLAEDRKRGRRFIGLLCLSLLVAYVVSWGATLKVEYDHAVTLDRRQESPINPHGVNGSQWRMLNAPIDYEQARYNLPHNPAYHFGFGFGLTMLLAYLRLTFVWWPFHPIGYLILQTYPGGMLWFSFFLGWMAKLIIVKLGGHTLYVGLRPLFLGMIVGESVAAGFWLVTSLGLLAGGYDFIQIRIMPE